MSQTTVNQRIKILIKGLDISSRGFSASIDSPDATTRNYIDGRAKPGADYLEKVIRRYAHVNPMWLLTGDGEMFLSDAAPKTNVSVGENSGNVIGQNQGGLHQNLTPQTATVDCEKSLAVAQKEVELLREQLAGKDVLLGAKDDLIAAKEEMLSLLRAGHNRPN